MAKSDSRRFRRMALNLPAQITVNAVDEYEGRLLNISPGNLALISDAKTVQGDAVIIRIKDLAEIEGTVARVLPDGFAVSFLLSKRRRLELTERLMLKANVAFNEGLQDRRSTLRRRAAPVRTMCRVGDGASFYVKILDSSVDGAAVEAPKRPPIGAEVHVGRRSGTVIRHTPRGFVVVYVNEKTAPAQVLRAI